MVVDDGHGDERHHTFEPAPGAHQYDRELSLTAGLHRHHAQRRHRRSHEHRRRFLRRRLPLSRAVDLPRARCPIKDGIVVVVIDRAAPLAFLQTAFDADDWVAVFLKSYQSGRIAQRVRPVPQIQASRFQAWLRAENAAGANVYVSVNTVAPRQRSRRREAVREIRHVFLDADHAAQDVLAAIEASPELPNPSYVLQSSPGRAHLFWRVKRFTCDTVEALEKHLARKLGTDPAATACTQVTRLPGFVNHKRGTPYLVGIEYRDSERVYEPADFPKPPSLPTHPPARSLPTARNAIERARQYIAAIPPAISGQHGDLHTFRVCCRVARGFALADDDALAVLRDWNSRCEPPWSDRELIDKLLRARRYGREPIGCLLEERP